jgi:negative regulator of sigma E activity
MKAHEMVVLVVALLAPVASPRLAEAENAGSRDTLAPFSVPSALAWEHDQIYQTLVRITREPGRLGEAATVVAVALEYHFDKEEAYALPPLALLPMLARGEVSTEMREILPITDGLAVVMPELVAEHRRIAAAVEDLQAAARSEGRFDIEELGDQILRHAQTEERIMYPAAILVGEMVELRLGRAAWDPDSR